MKPGYKTTEFWLTLITSVSGLLVALGTITPTESATANTALAQIIGGVVSLVSLVQYIKGRAQVKTALIAAGKKVA